MRMSCGFEASAKTEYELMKKMTEDDAQAHSGKSAPPDILVKIRSIKNSPSHRKWLAWSNILWTGLNSFP